MKKLIIASVVLSLCGCAMTDTKETVPDVNQVPEKVYLSGMSNELATDALLVSLINKNYMAKKVASNRIGVQLGGHQFVLQPSLNPQGVDRILASRYYAVHPKLANSQELMVLIGSLNHKLNFAKFTLRDNGKVIQVQGAATFVGTLELEELRRFLIWTDDALKQVAKSLPNSAEELIKPMPVMP